jgi:hypothetical protein
MALPSVLPSVLLLLLLLILLLAKEVETRPKEVETRPLLGVLLLSVRSVLGILYRWRGGRPNGRKESTRRRYSGWRG